MTVSFEAGLLRHGTSLMKIPGPIIPQPPVAAGAADLVGAGERRRRRGGALGEVGQQVAEVHQPLGDDMGDIAFGLDPAGDADEPRRHDDALSP